MGPPHGEDGTEPAVEKGIAFSQQDLDHNTHNHTLFNYNT